MLYSVIFIGRSGCGKGTQAALLREYIHKRELTKRQIIYIETGDRFRNFIRENSFSATMSKKVYESDERQPDFLACYMWASMLIEELGPDMHLMFDGAPRSRAEAELITTAMDFYKREELIVIYINVGRRWSEERLLSRGRSDDKSISKITKRLDWFDTSVLPAIEYFKSDPKYRYIEVNGEQTIEQVHRDIITALEYRKKNEIKN
jgi:adenylate kinase family enzyme